MPKPRLKMLKLISETKPEELDDYRKELEQERETATSRKDLHELKVLHFAWALRSLQQRGAVDFAQVRRWYQGYPMECGEERPWLDGERPVGDLTNPLRNSHAMQGPKRQGTQNQQIQRASQEVGLLGGWNHRRLANVLVYRSSI